MNNIYSNQLKSRTMRKVYGIWFMKRVLPWLAAEFVVLSTIFAGAQSYLSFGHILTNAVVRVKYYSLLSFSDFLMSAVTNADLFTLTMLVGAFFVGTLVVRDTIRATRRMRAGNFLRMSRVLYSR